jgi:hypothetical protein
MRYKIILKVKKKTNSIIGCQYIALKWYHEIFYHKLFDI